MSKEKGVTPLERVRSEIGIEKSSGFQEHQAKELWVFALVYLYISCRGHISHYY